MKSTAANAHKLSSVGTVAISFDQRITEEAFFIFLFAQCWAAGKWLWLVLQRCFSLVVIFRVEIVLGKLLTPFEHDGIFAEITQLANVPWPAIVLEHFDRAFGQIDGS